MDPEKFQVVQVHETGERYALRMLHRDVVGACGPLSPGEATATALPHLTYTTELAEWFIGEYIVGGNVRYDPVPPDEE
jgi:hypothetical protein